MGWFTLSPEQKSAASPKVAAQDSKSTTTVTVDGPGGKETVTVTRD